MYTKEAFTYSDQDRLLTHTHQIGTGGTPQLLASNTYDELGQLIGKNVGNTLEVPLQKVNYAYNIRGWLTGVNNDPTNNLVLNTGEKDLFGFKINYNTVQNETGYTGKSLYNGNISETYWRVSSDNVLRKYGYKYDNLNRLRESIYQKPGNSNPVPKSYDENLTYDKNGNILSLLRNGDIDGALPPNNIDNLVYTYASNANKLLSVLDTSNNNIAGFVDANKSGDDYTYDANGNLITDKNKNITAIVYNHLNLPTKITFGTTGNIVYIYNANGQKLEKIVTIGVSPVVKTQYLVGFQYKDNVLQFFPTAEGYVKNTNGIYSYVFNYTDHLGNVRLSYSDTSKNGLIETTEIVDESHYYPFGLKHSGYVTAVPDPNYKYKYNGKELQDELGLNMYDYGARNYDPALGRWMNMDPLAEMSRRFSPYTYAVNNPVFFIDPDGMMQTPNGGSGLDEFDKHKKKDPTELFPGQNDREKGKYREDDPNPNHQSSQFVDNLNFEPNYLAGGGGEKGKSGPGKGGKGKSDKKDSSKKSNLVLLASINPPVTELGMGLFEYVEVGGVKILIEGVKIAKESELAEKIVVIGEDMTNRVIPFAEKYGFKYFKPTGTNPKNWMRNQSQWIYRQIKDPTVRIIDIGAKGLEATSKYYKKELEMLNKYLGY